MLFSNQELENYLKILKERQERDHRRLGRELDLFMLNELWPWISFLVAQGNGFKKSFGRLLV